MFLDRNHEKRQSPFPLHAVPLTGAWVGGVESLRTIRCYHVGKANSCLIEEYMRMPGSHNTVEYCSETHIKENSSSPKSCPGQQAPA